MLINTAGVIARSAERATRQSLYKKARFVFGRDCRVARSALLAMTRGAFALLAMTAYSFRCTSNDRQQRCLFGHSPFMDIFSHQKKIL
ncbi:MAG: hypothetical protein LBL66_08325 [Clostridiales bacterium]|nr:hypothetical protein [Clostridiales bacterium]